MSIDIFLDHLLYFQLTLIFHKYYIYVGQEVEVPSFGITYSSFSFNVHLDYFYEYHNNYTTYIFIISRF